MNKNNYARFISGALGVALLTVAVIPAYAETTIGVSASTTISARKQENQANRLPTIISRSNTAIENRINDLNKLNARVQALKNVSATEKTTIVNQITTTINALTSLKAKIDSDTDVMTALADEKTITGSYRIYALIVPQGYIAASADRIDTLVSMLTTVSAKLQTRITAAQSAGKNVAALQASLTDLTAKIADAKTQASTAQNGIASLVPDQGNTTEFAANTAALKAARANIKTATQDLKAAQKDAQSILQGLRTLDVKTKTSASASTSVSTTNAQ